jgi:hypothetical protein
VRFVDFEEIASALELFRPNDLPDLGQSASECPSWRELDVSEDTVVHDG